MGAGPGNAYDLEWTDPSTGQTKMSHPLNLPFTSITVVPTAEQANPVAYRAFWLPGRNFSFVGSIVTRKGDLLDLCCTEGVDITDAAGKALTVAGLRAALRLHYTELYKAAGAPILFSTVHGVLQILETFSFAYARPGP